MWYNRDVIDLKGNDMRCNCCDAVCNDIKDTYYDDTIDKFITICNNCKSVIKDTLEDYVALDDDYDLTLEEALDVDQ